MNKSVYVAWRSGGETNGEWGAVGRLDRTSSAYRFVYTQGAKMEGFHPFPGMTDLNTVYESNELFPLFANRLLATSRPEYQSYLQWSGFGEITTPDPIAVLSVTAGERATDLLEIIPAPQPDVDNCYTKKFFLHGIRWAPPAAIERINSLNAGDWLGLMPDINNDFDSNAVAVRTHDNGGRFMIGYVPRFLAGDIRELIRVSHPSLFRLTVQRVNASAPLQFRLLCQFRANWPRDFQPSQEMMYQPIPNLAA